MTRHSKKRTGFHNLLPPVEPKHYEIWDKPTALLMSRKSGYSMRHASRFFVGLSVLLIVTGCSTDSADWERAVEINNLHTYREYLREHPEGRFVEDAQRKVSLLEWQLVRARDDRDVYREYIRDHPDSRFTEIAQERLEELDWERAVSIDDLHTYREYMREHPESRFVEDAQKKVTLLEWEWVRAQDDGDVYREYIRDHPDSRFTEIAQERLEELTEEAAWHKCVETQSPTRTWQYLRDYPQGTYVKNAHKQMQEIFEKLAREPHLEVSAASARQLARAAGLSAFAVNFMYQGVAPDTPVNYQNNIFHTDKKREYLEWMEHLSPTTEELRNLLSVAEWRVRMLAE